MTRRSPSPSPVVVGIAALALGVAGVTLWSVATLVAYVLGRQGLAVLALVLLAAGLATFVLVRARRAG
ncbi:hypothetical protein [Nonomuraea sp. NPDC049725]|uniref:hypothetical protein n=1 Tax=Nonomuraea sp. NPDC049725 TaxID=3154508 RepID=UPI003418E3E3